MDKVYLNPRRGGKSIMQLAHKIIQALEPGVRFIMTVDAATHLCKGKNVLFVCGDDKVKEEKMLRIAEQTELILSACGIEPEVEVFMAEGKIKTPISTLYVVSPENLLEDGRFKGLKIASVCVIHR